MRKIFLALLALVMSAGVMAEDQFVNLTPRPKSIKVGTGVWTMPQALTVGTGQLGDELVAEAQKFADVVKTATGREVTVAATTAADIVMKVNTAIANPEGYKVTVAADGITAEAATATGFFYAFQTIKKIMPANVMAGVYDEKVADYTAPVCTIDDEPRFEYRGFMLDVCRHFFDVAQVKRMLDVMAYYKLNKFHWHLSDDQGWRIEIKKYPKLCTIGATRDFSYEVDPVYGRYQTYEPYGPYFYTQDEAREVVEYAAKLHIEVIPEIDMPGHFVAAMTAYPEFSCWPNGNHSVWTDGGISTDVLNVANPAAVQFTKDIMTELAAVFPSREFHIGGDECPTSAWEGNADCQAMWKALGSPKLSNGNNNYRILQTHFIKQMDEHAKSLGKHLFLWNEAIAANGADQDIIQSTDATIMCWTNPYPAALTASARKLNVIITPWGPYYINRVQSTDPGEPVGAGNGADTAERTYNEVPVPSNVPAAQQPYYKGVQGTFWCEHVGSRYLLEYLALPRLICVAEAGWTPQNLKNWENFKKRWNEDYKMLDYNGYYYGHHFLEKKNDNDEKVMPKDGAYYRVVTTATDAARAGNCIEVLPEGSPKIGTGNAQAMRLWQMPQVTDESSSEYDYQWFTFELDPSGSGFYAMVCKALPEGSVKPKPTSTTNAGRFDYDPATKHYAWQLGTHTYGQMANGHYKYTIHSTQQPASMYVNAAAGGQHYSVNQWSDPADGNGGIWEFVPAVEEVVPAPEVAWPEVGAVIRIENAVKHGIMLYADETANLKNGTSRLTANAWQVTALGEVSGTSRTIQLLNVATGKYISNVTSSPVAVGTAACDVTLTWNTDSLNWNLSSMAPVGANYKSYPNCLVVKSNSDGGTVITPIYPQGTAWHFVAVTPVTINCVDTEGKAIATYHSSLAEGEELAAEMLPAVKNHALKSLTAEGDVYTAVYEREAYSIVMRGVDSRGIILTETEVKALVGVSVALTWPAYDFGELVEAEVADGTELTPTDDITLTATYRLGDDAVVGFSRAGDRVTKVEKNKAYLIYNAMPTDATRNGFLHTQEGNALWLVRGATQGDPSYVWTTTASGSNFKFGNETGLWIGTMQRGTNMTAVAAKSSAAAFSLTKSADGTFKVKGTANNYYWNANSGGGFTGWDDGHPYEFYTLHGQPYYHVTIVETTLDYNGTELSKTTTTQLLKGGAQDAASLLAAYTDREGYTLAIEGAEGLAFLRQATVVSVTYTQKVPDAVRTAKASTATGTYDLSGRKTLKRHATRQIYLKGK